MIGVQASEVGRAAAAGGGEEAGRRSVSREELLAFYEGKVAKWWMPDDVVFVDELPHTATGKLPSSRCASSSRIIVSKLPSIRELKERVGQEVAVSPWLDVSQERIDTFAKAIEDFQWIHVDPARAKSSPFGGTIAHGFLTLSLLSHLSEIDLLVLRPQDGRQLRLEPGTLHLAGAQRRARAGALHAG